MTEAFPIPASLLEHARAFYASGASPATPKLAATVLLLRPGPEVYMIRRVSTMAFAARMHVFPGGTVDPRDAEAQPCAQSGTRGSAGPPRPGAWAGPTPAEWATRLGLDEPYARAVVSAAVREVFEESGVLLAGPDASTVVGDVSGQEWESARLALIAREIGFAELLADRGLVVRSDLLTPWARWLTPEIEPRRYDTYFFLARLPERQVTRDVGGEADQVVWGRPQDLAGLPMLPPTLVALRRLGGYPDVDAAMLAACDVTTPVLPRVDLDGEAPRLVISGSGPV